MAKSTHKTPDDRELSLWPRRRSGSFARIFKSRRLRGLIGLFAILAHPAQAASDARQSRRDAAYLQDAFSHDLCTRNDRDLRKLNKALSRTSADGAR